MFSFAFNRLFGPRLLAKPLLLALPVLMSAGALGAETSGVSPALAEAKEKLVDQELWHRPGLSGRDRSLVTLGAMIARDQSSVLAPEIDRALDNGLTPAEISEVIYHLAFYAGLGNAEAAANACAEIFAKRHIPQSALPPAKAKLLALDKDTEAKRKALVAGLYGDTAPGVVHYTTEALFLNLWLRPALAPRDRSLVTVSALIATGQAEQVPFHLNKAMDNGLTQSEASEMLTQLAFYAGWPKVFSALPVVKKVFASRKGA